MGDMVDKIFSSKLAEQMTGFYGKQKMLRKLNNKLEMKNDNTKIVELDKLVSSYQDKLERDGQAAMEACGGDPDNCPELLMSDEQLTKRFEEVLAEAYEHYDDGSLYDRDLDEIAYYDFQNERE